MRTDASGNLYRDDDHDHDSKSAVAGNYHPVTVADAWSVPSPVADEPNGTGVAIGGSVSGNIDVTGDVDVYTMSLIAGQTYSVSLRGTGENALEDSFLQIGSPTDTLVIEDDDGGNGLYSIVTFTAATTGTYSIVASSFSNPGDPGLGTYTIDVRQRGADAVGSSNATSVAIDPGTVFGFRETGADVDRYAVTLEAGRFYTFEVAGGADYNTDYLDVPTGELDTILRLRNAGGTIIASNDDLNFPSDISSGLGFFAETSGTYYLDVTAYGGQTGGYVLDYNSVDLSAFDPLDALDWVNADNVPFVDVDGTPTAYVYFAPAGENFGETADDGVSPMVTFGWNAFEQQQVMLALAQYEQILGVNYEITTDVNQATFRLLTTSSEDYGAYFYPQDPVFGTQQGIGVFNVDSGGWNFGQQQSLLQGGYAFAVILHEFGHAHGLAHPHDRGGGSDVMLGVTASTGSYGVFDLNQGVYTVMSYNDAFPRGPNGETPFTAANVDSGWSGTLSAFDIAILQERYGVLAPHATGNTVYDLGDANDPGVYYQTIWDSAGIDEIRYSGTRDARIDLLAATIDYSPTGGGVMSYVDGIFGGYTIARGVVIENASGGDGDDVIIGNSAVNRLNGNAGDDFLMGKEGGDILDGGSGFDTVSYVSASAGITASLVSMSGFGGDAAGDRYVGVEKLEGSQFDDMLISGDGADTLWGLRGNDTLQGGNSNDTLEGGDGEDRLDGGNQNDLLSGGLGDDSLSGGNHDDVLHGGDGDDALNGGNQADLLNGGAGDDMLSGGNHNDVFAFAETGGDDRVIDFRRGQDKIDLSAIDAVAGGSDDAFSWVGSNAFSGAAGELRSYSEGGNTYLAGDTDGDGAADFTIQTNLLIITADLIL